jgi:hypothetical protein
LLIKIQIINSLYFFGVKFPKKNKASIVPIPTGNQILNN